MTTVDEEILLHEPVDPSFDNFSALDEDLLLGAGDVSRKPTQESADDAASLSDAPGAVAEQNEPPKEEHEELKEPEEHEEPESEKEELDYDEEEDDEERRERTSRYTSEKKRVDSTEGDENKEENGKKRSGIPSLFDKTITNNPLISGDKPIGVILRIEGEQERVFYPPPNFMADTMPPNIVPRLPNGIPLVGMPANHGRAGFGQGYRDRLTGGGGGVPDPVWQESVAMFLNNVKTTSSRSRRKRRSSSYSRSTSSSSSSRSRSSSRDRRRQRKEPRRERRRRHDERRHQEKREDRRRREKHSSMESAKALGLSSEYMEQVNEQKRKREEIVRKKEERRHGEKKEVAPAPTAPTEQKTKAFLAVNVAGVRELPTAVKKIGAMATELGPIKKCWRSSEDTVSIIFNAHDKAKEFMIKFNGKVLSGLRITVSLEKKFLNLNEVN